MAWTNSLGKDSWTRLSLIGDETVINLQSTKVYVFSDSVLCLGRVLQHPKSNEAWKNRVAGIQSRKSYRDHDVSMESQLNSSGTFSEDSQRYSSVLKSVIYWAIWDTPETFTGSFLFMSMFYDILWQKRQQDSCFEKCRICESTCEKIWYWAMVIYWIRFWEEMVFFREQSTRSLGQYCRANVAGIWHPTFRATTPLSRGQLKRKGRGKLFLHFTADQDTIDTIYRIILSVNQLSVYGAVAAVCEEFQSHQDGSVELVILIYQSIVLGEIKAEVPLQNKVGKFCKEAGFMRIVEVGQYFMTKDTGDIRQFRSVACREYTLPRDDRASQPKGWIQGNMRIGLVLEVTTSFQLFKYGIEIRIGSVNQDNSHSWVRISYGIVKCVNDSFKDDTEIPMDTLRKASSTNKHECGYSQVKGKSKTTTERTCWYNSNHTNTWKKMDWHWAIRTKSCFVRSLEESDQSSSTQSNVTAIRRWSNWILQDKILSSKSSFTNTELVWWSMESLFGCRRRFETKISVLLW